MHIIRFIAVFAAIMSCSPALAQFTRIGTVRRRSPTGSRAKPWYQNLKAKAGKTSPSASRTDATSCTRSMRPADGCMASSIPQG